MPVDQPQHQPIVDLQCLGANDPCYRWQPQSIPCKVALWHPFGQSYPNMGKCDTVRYN